MRIAVLSDIHGMLPALEAVLADASLQRPDQIWCAGDIAFGGPWAAECIARVREEGWITVRGNGDIWITGDPQTVSDQELRAHLMRVAEQHALDADDAQWLLNLPLGHSGPGSVLMVHARPDSAFTAPQPDAPASEFEGYDGQADLVLYGHVHRAFTRRLTGGTIVCNPGSVGIPFDGDTASYLVLDQGGAEWSWFHRRVEFDRQSIIDEIHRVGGAIQHDFELVMERRGG